MDERSSRYAHPEYERRFLLDDVPVEADQPRLITDRYITGTRLRLRIITDPDSGRVIQRKIGHKVRPDPIDPTEVLHTSVYLDPDEATVLAALDAVEVVKARRRWVHGGHSAAVDVYYGDLAGLIVAELNFADQAALAAYTPRAPLGVEITRATELTGPNLPWLTAERLAAHLHAQCHRP